MVPEPPIDPRDSFPAQPAFDYILVGGGLANGLIALAILQKRPEARVLLVEREAEVGGNHTWCFHEPDLPAGARAFVEPLIVHSWDRYQVCFPKRSRTMDSRYSCISSERFRSHLVHTFQAAPNATLVTGTAAAEVSERSVRLKDGREMRALAVIDGRGPAVAPPRAGGYQKFVGLEVELNEDHGLEHPVLMDATVPQVDGFRFLYLLPFGPRRLLLEDTYFSHEPALDRGAVEERLRDIAAERGFVITRVFRTETGVLPMPYEGLPEPPSTPLRSGYGGGWFHPATGYSLPVAVRLAMHVAGCEPADLVGPQLERLAKRHRTQVRYAHWLNRMLFSCFEPTAMWNVFERFYRLPEPLIRRFYALELSTADRARILIGRPPKGISLRATVQSLGGRPA